MVLELSALERGHTQYKTMCNAFAPEWNTGKGASEFVYFFGEIIKFKQNIRFSDSLLLG